MRSAVAPDPAVRPLRNVAKGASTWHSMPGVGTPSTNAGFASVGATQATYGVTYDANDLPLKRSGYQTRVETFTGTGNYGRRLTWPTGEVPIRVGDTVRFMFWIKVNQAVTINPYTEYSDIAGGFISAGASPSPANVSLAANTWTLISVTASPTNAGTAWLRTCGYLNQAQINAGFELRFGPWFCTVNQTLPESFMEGDTPGWRWTGTIYESQSVGYPYTLESIVGSGYTLMENVVSSMTIYSLPSSSELSIATVQSADSASWNAAGLWQLTPQRPRRLMVTSSTNVQLGAEKTDHTGVLGVNVPVASANMLHTYVTTLTPVGGRITVDDKVPVNLSQVPGLVMDTYGTGIQFGARDSSFWPGIITKAAVIIPRSLNDETARRVVAWLARKYGASVPSGY